MQSATTRATGLTGGLKGRTRSHGEQELGAGEASDTGLALELQVEAQMDRADREAWGDNTKSPGPSG